MENGKVENSGNNSANSTPTGWESLEAEGRRHNLMLKVKAKFSSGNFKKAVSIAMLSIMTAGTLIAGNTDKNTVAESVSVETEADTDKHDYDVTDGAESILGETHSIDETYEQVEGETEPVVHAPVPMEPPVRTDIAPTPNPTPSLTPPEPPHLAPKTSEASISSFDVKPLTPEPEFPKMTDAERQELIQEQLKARGSRSDILIERAMKGAPIVVPNNERTSVNKNAEGRQDQPSVVDGLNGPEVWMDRQTGENLGEAQLRNDLDDRPAVEREIMEQGGGF